MSKLRTDSWAANLTEEQAWALYYKARGLRWFEVTHWAMQEYGTEPPSRTAFYAWLAHMRGMESAHRLEQAATAAAEAAALAKTKTSDEAQIAAYKAMATELALRTGSAKEAEKFIQMAATLADKRLKAAELKLKDRAQQTKDETLRLAREKFEAAERRLAAVQDAVKSAKASGGGLTPETLKKIEEAAGLL